MSESAEPPGFFVCPRNLSKSTNKGALQHNANRMARFKRKLHQQILLSFLLDADSYYSPKELKLLMYKLKHQNLPDDIKYVSRIFKQELKAILRYIRKRLQRLYFPLEIQYHLKVFTAHLLQCILFNYIQIKGQQYIHYSYYLEQWPIQL